MALFLWGKHTAAPLGNDSCACAPLSPYGDSVNLADARGNAVSVYTFLPGQGQRPLALLTGRAPFLLLDSSCLPSKIFYLSINYFIKYYNENISLK